VSSTSATDPQALSDDDAARRQADALDISGWGERFTFLQPRNACFWVYSWLMLVGLVQAWSYFDPKIGFYGDALAISGILCILFGGAWWLWLRHIDRWERQPAGLVVAGAAWGAIAATFAFAMTVNTAMLSLYAKLFGQEWAADWAAGFTAPLTEEAAKVCGFVLLMGLAPRLVRTANDGLVIGAFIGLGFAAFEDFLYAANSTGNAFGTDPVGNAVQLSFTRFAVGFISHPLFSALVCCGVVYVIGTVAQQRRVGRGLFFIAAGMVLHFTWDDAGALGGHGAAVFLVMVASAALGFTLLAVAFRAAAPREHDLVRDILAPEVREGTLSGAELEAVLDKKERKAFTRSAPNRRAKRERKHLRRAILDLTHAVAASRGSTDDDVAHARSEVARIRERAELATA
jgi:protease PrsW